MKDISILANYPKGRSGHIGNWWKTQEQIIYPEQMPFSHKHILKLCFWKASTIARCGDERKYIIN